MKFNVLKQKSLILLLPISFLGCGSGDGDKGIIIADCNLAAHHEIDGTPRDDVDREYTLGELVNKCLKGKGLTPEISKSGCLVEAKSPEHGKSYIKALQECWRK